MKEYNIIEEEIFEEIETESSKMNSNRLDEIISEEKIADKKSSQLDLKRYSGLIKQIKLAMSLIKDFRNKAYTDIPWRSVAFIAGAVLYFVNPFDVVPDMLPIFGFGDDAMFFAAVFKSIQTDLQKYGEWKGINKDNYF